MITSVIYLFVFIVVSAHARTAVSDKSLDTVVNNEINVDDLNVTEIHINPPAESKTHEETVKDIESNVIHTDDVTKSPNEATNDSKYEVTSKKPLICVNSTNDDLTVRVETDAKSCEVKPEDHGEALILTPLIKEGKIEEARNASRVNPDLFLGIESYSGFLTVNETYNSNLFFWYFPVEGKPVNETPWIIWLQGGPGASSLTGLFDEIGPFFVGLDGNLNRNPFAWSQEHSLVFIDNPVGSGYSFTSSEDGFTTDMDTYGEHLYCALKQLVRVFPELRAAPLFVAGESYGGKYVPALAVRVHRNRDAPGGDINLKGLIVGNGYVDPGMITNLARPFLYFGLLETEQMEIVRPLVEAFQQDIAARRSIEAKKKWNYLITILLLLTHQKHAYNFLRDDLAVGRYIAFLWRSDVKRALHVGDIRFSVINMTVNTRLNGEFLSSAKPLYEELLDEYPVLTYCGQLDQMLSCVLTSENYRTWRWNASQQFVNATRYPFIYKNRLAGYHKSGGHLTEVVIRGAGHMAPLDAPGPTRELVSRWVRAEPLDAHPSIFDGTFVTDYVRNTTGAGTHYF